MVDETRRRALGGHAGEDGKWVLDHYDRLERIIYCTDDPDALRVWLESHIDVRKFLKDIESNEYRENIVSMGYCGLLEVVEEGETYKIRPDYVHYHSYRRD